MIRKSVPADGDPSGLHQRILSVVSVMRVIVAQEPEYRFRRCYGFSSSPIFRTCSMQNKHRVSSPLALLVEMGEIVTTS